MAKQPKKIKLKIEASAAALANADTIAHAQDIGSADTLAASREVAQVAQVGATSSEKERYHVEGEIARGGLGKILRAHDQKLNRPVAIKQLIRAEGDQSRFLYEALTTAKLQHPAIVPVYEAGRWNDGEPYFAMKYVSGKPFDQVIQETRTLDERLILLPRVIDVCEAMAYAHSLQIIHRDLKPQNVLLGEFGETVVIDWGLAKDLSSKRAEIVDGEAPREPSAPDLTLDGSVVGTPMYMPPEQAQGKPVDERADVYSLGAILYHLLAGGPPFQGKSSLEILRGLSSHTPTPLQLRQPETPRELVTIVEKAMSRDARERYPSAKELAEELRRFQNGQLVQSHQYTWWQRVKRRAARNKAATIAALIALLITIGFLYQALLVYQTNEKLIISDRKLKDENEKAMTLAETLRQGMIAQTVSLSKEQLARAPLETLRNLLHAWEKEMLPLSEAQWGVVRNLAAQALSQHLPRLVASHQGTALRAIFSADGKSSISAGSAGEILVTPLAGGPSRQLSSEDAAAISALYATPDGEALLSCSLAGSLRRWDLATGESRVLLSQGEQRSLLVSSDGALLAVLAEGEARLLSTRDGAILFRRPAPEATRLQLSASSLAIALRDGSIELWDWQGGQAKTLSGHSAAITNLVFSQDGASLFSVDSSGELRAWTVSTQSSVILGQLPLQRQSSILRVSPSGRWLVASDAQDLWLFNLLQNDAKLSILRNTQGELQALSFSPDDEVFATAGKDGTVRLWDPWTRTSTTLRGHQRSVWSTELSADGRLLSSGQDGSVFLWAPDFHSPADPTLTPRDLSRDGETSLFQREGGQLIIKDKSGSRETTRSHQATLTVLHFSEDSQWLVSAASDASLLLHRVSTGESLPLESAAVVNTAAFSPDARWLATGDKNNQLMLWDLETRRARLILAHEKSVSAVAFSADGTLLASCGYDQKLHLYSLREERVVQTFSSSSLVVRALAFSPDAETLAAGGGDGKLLFYSLKATAQAPVELLGRDSMLYRLQFSRAGGSLLSMDVEHTATLWDFSGVSIKDASARVIGDEGATLGATFSGEGVSLLDLRGFVTQHPARLPEDTEALRALIETSLKTPQR